jgi:thioredoxin-related protein
MSTLVRSLLLVLAIAATAMAAPEYPKFGNDIYDPYIDGKILVVDALKRASADHKHVLLIFGANWCIWCHRLHDTLASDATLAQLVHQDYEVVMIDVNKRHGTARNADVDGQYGNPTKLGLPVLVVLDEKGKQLTTQDSGELENGKDGHDPAKIAAFLRKWAPARG